jgi:dolichol-phosphate mannosyltransferase
MIRHMTTNGTDISIIVPAYREAPNLHALVERVFRATSEAAMDAELIVVDDDSRDGTEQVIRSLQERYPVRLIVRQGERGLASAVLRGFAEARHDILVVLDADLQHPPELIPTVVHRLRGGDCDFVIASRYAGGKLAENWPWPRRLASRIATILARPLAPVSDPMSGFFALRRQTWLGAERLDPIGYKIALELMVKSRCRNPVEIPIEFASRRAGESKAGLKEMTRYLRHLWRLYRFAFPVLSGLAIGLTVMVVLAAGFWLWDALG